VKKWTEIVMCEITNVTILMTSFFEEESF